MPAALFDETGKPLTLGSEIGRGGEGVVYDLLDRSNSLAKIYQKPLSPDHIAKLMAMSQSGTGELLKLAAWPTGVVVDRGKPIGFAMSKFTGFKPAFELYGPNLRLQKFPKADWRFLIRAAANTARAVAAVHDAGHVIGDINHGNMIIGPDATVRLIDCDSFQVSIGNETWFCEVGVATHQPPELQGASFRSLKRTPNHDAFGTAVLIFQLLCLARHPFSGKWLGPGEQPAIEDAIRAFRYAYSSNQFRTQMAPPPGSLPAHALGEPVRSLFEQAFSPAGAKPAGRPRAAEWIQALTSLEGSLRQCSAVPSHHFLDRLSNCPWCAIELESGTMLFPGTLFPGPIVRPAAGADGFLILWQQVEAVAIPRLKQPPPVPKPSRPSRSAQQVGLLRKYLAVCFVPFIAILWLMLSQLGSGPPDPQIFWLLFAPAAVVFGLVLHLAGRNFFLEKRVLDKKWRLLSFRIMSNMELQKAKELKDRSKAVKAEYDAAVDAKNAALAALHANRRAGDIAAIENAFLQQRRGLEQRLANHLADLRNAAAAAARYDTALEREKAVLIREYAMALANQRAASLLS